MKFFDFVKAYGFIIPENGGPDIHIAGRVLSDAGFIRCPPGTPIEVWFNTDRKGRVAVKVAPLGEE